MGRELTDEDYKCPQCGCKMVLKDCKNTGAGWIYTLECPVHKVQVPILKTE